MRIDDIECFRILAETLNYTNAADRLYLTPSSLTRIIQQMEAELGFQLFDRSRRSVSLTAAGQSFYLNSEGILASYYAAAEKARYAQEGHSGIIRLAVNVYFVNSFVYELLNDYQTGHPDILVRVSGSNTERMIYDLNTGTIDCAICTGRPADRDIERIVLRKYRDCAVFSTRHPLAQRGEVAFAELKQERFVVIARSLARRGYEQIRARARDTGFDASVEENASSVAHLLAIVATGRYVTLLSDNYRSLAAGRLKFVPLADKGTVELSFLWNRNCGNPCVPIFADYIRKNCKRKASDSE